jgi:hypothetical protein
MKRFIRSGTLFKGHYKKSITMAQRKYYYKREDAQHLKETFESWINKSAQAGNGEHSILKNIVVRPKRTIFIQDPSLQTYSVEFQFYNSKAIDSSHFLICNGLNNLLPKHDEVNPVPIDKNGYTPLA